MCPYAFSKITTLMRYKKLRGSSSGVEIPSIGLDVPSSGLMAGREAGSRFVLRDGILCVGDGPPSY